MGISSPALPELPTAGTQGGRGRLFPACLPLTCLGQLGTSPGCLGCILLPHQHSLMPQTSGLVKAREQDVAGQSLAEFIQSPAL